MSPVDPWEEGENGKDTEEPVLQQSSTVDIPSLAPREEATVLFTQFYPPMQSPTLYSLTIELLAAHLDQVVTLPPDTLQCIPSAAKSALLAVARRTNTLTKHVLTALTDPHWEALDLAYTPFLSDRAIVQCLKVCGARLRYLDISRSSISYSTLAALPSLCPLLEVLRVGGTDHADERTLMALPSLLPRSITPLLCMLGDGEDAHVCEDWEQAVWSGHAGGAQVDAAVKSNDAPGYASTRHHDSPPSTQHNNTTQPSQYPPSGGLLHLRYLCWPHPPSAALKILARRAPWVEINPPAHRGMLPTATDSLRGGARRGATWAPRGATGAPRVPPEAIMEVPLDQRWLWNVRPSAWDGARLPKEDARLALPIARRFQLAYEELEGRTQGGRGKGGYACKGGNSRGWGRVSADDAIEAWFDDAG